MRKLSGTVTACITPFTEFGVDSEGLRENLEEQIAAGVDALLVLGTTGEAATMSAAERRHVVALAAEVAKGRVPLWVGTGCSSTKETIERSNEAKELGADVALVVTPYYNCPTQEGILAHVRALHSATEIDICLYNHPKRSGTSMENRTILALAELERVVALKEASDSIEKLQELIAAAREGAALSIYCGNDTLAMASLALGADGLISVASNLLPKEVVEFVNRALEGDLEEARKRHYLLYPLFKILGIETNPIPIKRAMGEWQKAAGPCRLPLTEMREENLHSLLEELNRWKTLQKPQAKVKGRRRVTTATKEELRHGCKK